MDQLKNILSRIKGFFVSTKPFNFAVRTVFLPLSFIFMELVIRIADSKAPFTFLFFIRGLLAGGAAGMLLLLITHIIHKKGISRGIAMFFLYFMGLISMIQVGSRYRFGIYFQVGYMAKMAGLAAKNFMGDIIVIVLHNILALILLFLPAVLFTLLRKRIIPQDRSMKKRVRMIHRKHSLFYCMLFILLFLLDLFFCPVSAHNCRLSAGIQSLSGYRLFYRRAYLLYLFFHYTFPGILTSPDCRTGFAGDHCIPSMALAEPNRQTYALFRCVWRNPCHHLCLCHFRSGRPYFPGTDDRNRRSFVFYQRCHALRPFAFLRLPFCRLGCHDYLLYCTIADRSILPDVIDQIIKYDRLLSQVIFLSASQ